MDIVSNVNLLAVGAFGLGALAKLLVPWLIVRYRNPDAPESAWNWRYFWPQLVGFGIILLVAPLVTQDFSAINAMAPVPAYLAGWGTGDVAKTLFLDTGIGSK